jgi:hypothetical protein
MISARGDSPIGLFLEVSTQMNKDDQESIYLVKGLVPINLVLAPVSSAIRGPTLIRKISKVID